MTRAPILAGAERVRVRRAMREAYERDGLTIHQVAARFGRSYGATHKLLTEAATRIRCNNSWRGAPDAR